MARHFAFTRSHDIMIGMPLENYLLQGYYQWQNGTQVPIWPEGIREEAGGTIKFPPWPGSWDNIRVP